MMFSSQRKRKRKDLVADPLIAVLFIFFHFATKRNKYDKHFYLRCPKDAFPSLRGYTQLGDKGGEFVIVR